jgi:hypothetical protein
MSVVITSDRLSAYARSLTSYVHNFYGFLGDKVILGAGYQLPSAVDYITLIEDSAPGERLKMFWDWFESDKVAWPGFNRRWKFHMFETNLRQQYKDDWPPPMEYSYQFATKYALPQYPQQRVKISDPTDSLGKKRSIRVHYAEKSKTVR